MRWKEGTREATRRQILDSAGRLFRERGFARTSVADVMHDAGLTVGGFYAHFESKEQLLTEVLAGAFGRTNETLFAGLDEVSGSRFVGEVMRRYLSRAHRDAVDTGCPLPTLAVEIGREGAAPRAEIERYLGAMLELLRAKAPTSRAGLGPGELTLALVALSVGGLVLARAVRDERLSDAILQACRRLAAAELAPT